MTTQKFVNAMSILGIGFLLLAIGFLLPKIWQSTLIILASLFFMFFAYKTFIDDGVN
jgi:hypothetical protein